MVITCLCCRIIRKDSCLGWQGQGEEVDIDVPAMHPWDYFFFNAHLELKCISS